MEIPGEIWRPQEDCISLAKEYSYWNYENICWEEVDASRKHDIVYMMIRRSIWLSYMTNPILSFTDGFLFGSLMTDASKCCEFHDMRQEVSVER